MSGAGDERRLARLEKKASCLVPDPVAEALDLDAPRGESAVVERQRAKIEAMQADLDALKKQGGNQKKPTQ